MSYFELYAVGRSRIEAYSAMGSIVTAVERTHLDRDTAT